MSERESLFFPMKRHVNEIAISPEDESSAPVVDEIESLCMNCHENVCCRVYYQSFVFSADASP